MSQIRDYYAQILIKNKWIKLEPIMTFEDGRFYYIPTRNMKDRIGNRIEFNAKTFDEQIKNKNLTPGETITGILMFYLKDRNKYVSTTFKNDNKYISLPAKQIKLVFLDSLKHEEEPIFNVANKENKKKDTNYQGFFGAFGWTVKEVDVDLKQFNIVNDY